MPRQRRKNFRVECSATATIHDLTRGSAWPCSISDVSNQGVKITGVLAFAIPDEFVLCFPHGRARQCRVCWRLAFALGAEFTDCVTKPEETQPDQAVLEAAE